MGETSTPTSPAAVAAAAAAHTEPLILVQSGDAEIENRQSASAIPAETSGASAAARAAAASVNESVAGSALNCLDIRIVTATEMSDEPFQAFTFDGVLGLGLDSLALAPEFSLFGMMVEQKSLGHPSFGVFLADSDDEVSEISFGGHSPEKVASPLTWAPVALPELGYWLVQIKALRIGNKTLDYCNDGKCHAVVDTGTSLLAVPHDFVDELSDELEGPLRDPAPSSGGSVDCRFAEGLPLHFDIEEDTITLLPRDYARQALHADEASESEEGVASGTEEVAGENDIFAGHKTTCQPTMMPLELPEPLGPKLFIWGEPVLRKYYTVYDWKHKQIGFGLAAHSEQEEAEEEHDAATGENAAAPSPRGLLFT